MGRRNRIVDDDDQELLRPDPRDYVGSPSARHPNRNKTKNHDDKTRKREQQVQTQKTRARFQLVAVVFVLSVVAIFAYGVATSPSPTPTFDASAANVKVPRASVRSAGEAARRENYVMGHDGEERHGPVTLKKTTPGDGKSEQRRSSTNTAHVVADKNDARSTTGDGDNNKDDVVRTVLWREETPAAKLTSLAASHVGAAHGSATVAGLPDGASDDSKSEHRAAVAVAAAAGAAATRVGVGGEVLEVTGVTVYVSPAEAAAFRRASSSVHSDGSEAFVGSDERHYLNDKGNAIDRARAAVRPRLYVESPHDDYEAESDSGGNNVVVSDDNSKKRRVIRVRRRCLRRWWPRADGSEPPQSSQSSQSASTSSSSSSSSLQSTSSSSSRTACITCLPPLRSDDNFKSNLPVVFPINDRRRCSADGVAALRDEPRLAALFAALPLLQLYSEQANEFANVCSARECFKCTRALLFCVASSNAPQLHACVFCLCLTELYAVFVYLQLSHQHGSHNVRVIFLPSHSTHPN
jgi:hypothetical protein